MASKKRKFNEEVSFPPNIISMSRNLTPISKKEQPVEQKLPTYWGDRSQLLAHEVLSKHELVFNRERGLLICHQGGCQRVMTENWANHLKFHQTFKFLEKEEIVTIDEIRVSNPTRAQEDQPMSPIQGLPILKGFYCVRCGYISSSMASLKTHNVDHKDKIQFREIFFQQLSKQLKCEVGSSFPSSSPQRHQTVFHRSSTKKMERKFLQLTKILDLIKKKNSCNWSIYCRPKENQSSLIGTFPHSIGYFSKKD